MKVVVVTLYSGLKVQNLFLSDSLETESELKVW